MPPFFHPSSLLPIIGSLALRKTTFDWSLITVPPNVLQHPLYAHITPPLFRSFTFDSGLIAWWTMVLYYEV